MGRRRVARLMRLARLQGRSARLYRRSNVASARSSPACRTGCAKRNCVRPTKSGWAT